MPSMSPPLPWIDFIAKRQREEERRPLPDLPQAVLSMALLSPQFPAAFIFMPKFFICRCRSSPPGCRGVPHSVATELKLLLCCCLIICRNKGEARFVPLPFMHLLEIRIGRLENRVKDLSLNYFCFCMIALKGNSTEPSLLGFRI
jgi:hypothetical protein